MQAYYNPARMTQITTAFDPKQECLIVEGVKFADVMVSEKNNDGTLTLKGNHDNFSRLVLIDPEPQDLV